MISVSNGRVHLAGEGYSYLFYEEEGKLRHAYFGGRLPEGAMPEAVGYEAGEEGRGDFRIPSIRVSAEGCSCTDFRLQSLRVLPEKPKSVFPALRGGETLEAVLWDGLLGLRLTLYYTPYEEGLTRQAVLENTGGGRVLVRKFMSASLDLPAGRYDALTLNGDWGRECTPARTPLTHGTFSVGSLRGRTSHQHNNFLAVCERDTAEEHGLVYGLHLVYSGNFLAACEHSEKDGLRAETGMQFVSGIPLGKGEKLVSPEAVLVCSEEGFGGMSRKLHRLYRKRLFDARTSDMPRPVVVNSWEGMYFGVNEERLLRFIDAACETGVDTVVLDDGWFGRRNDDKSSLGDWQVNPEKFPHALDAVSARCKERGLRFGVWFEPEMVSPDSDLFRAHPGWHLHTEGRSCTEMRHQYALDFSREEVVDHVFGAMKAILDRYEIGYIKWDMNRDFTEVKDDLTYYKAVLGFYGLYARLRETYPDLFIEGCASGGGRFDLGVFSFSPMAWTSDDTDAFQRARIQYGASLCYPLQCLSNHVSACPNHQSGRTVPYETRYGIASLGALGYEFDPAELSAEERAEIAAQVRRYRADAPLILTGDLYRLADPFTENLFAEFVAGEDGKRGYLVMMRPIQFVNEAVPAVRLKGLAEEAFYSIPEREVTLSGAELMRVGIVPRFRGDFSCETLHLERVEGWTICKK